MCVFCVREREQKLFLLCIDCVCVDLLCIRGLCCASSANSSRCTDFGCRRSFDQLSVCRREAHIYRACVERVSQKRVWHTRGRRQNTPRRGVHQSPAHKKRSTHERNIASHSTGVWFHPLVTPIVRVGAWHRPCTSVTFRFSFRHVVLGVALDT
mgnify:CR=1 FL=1